MAVITALVMTMGRCFVQGAMTSVGQYAAAILIPVMMPKVMGAVKSFTNKAPVEEDVDPDLC